MEDSIPTAKGQPDPPKSFIIIRGFRVIRKSFEDDGLVRRVTKSWLYSTLTNLSFIWFVLEAFLWVVEILLVRKVMTYMMSPMDRWMSEMYGEKQSLSPLGVVLTSHLVWQIGRVVAVWWGFDIFLDTLYKILQRFTLEEHEIAKREYEEAKKALGYTSDDDEEKRSLDRLAESRPFRYLLNAVFLWKVICVLATVGIDFYAGYNLDPGSFDMNNLDLSSVNPYRRGLPSDQDGVLREVIYMAHVLGELTPTSLPGDDYDLYSNMLQNLETRRDLSWRIYEESELRQPVMSAAGRGGYRKEPIADEPFSIAVRVKALHKYWDGLALAPDKPERWEDASDTTFIKPLLQGRLVEGNGQMILADGGHKLILTPEQSLKADQVYNKWRKKYDREAAYLKDHPPKPIGWVQVSKSKTGRDNAWRSLFDDGKVAAGRHVPVGKLQDNKAWKPIYGSFHIIPFDKGNVEDRSDEELRAEIRVLQDEHEVVMARRDKQSEYLKELRRRLEEEKEKVKEEL